MGENRKRYVTVFPECEQVHLKKDVGMLPYSLGACCGYDFSLVCYEHPSFSEADIQKYHIRFVPRKRGDILDFSGYLWKHGKEIDILNLYHMSSRRNAVWIQIYKLVNPRGKVHLKLDADYRMLDVVDMKPKSMPGKLKIHTLCTMVDLYTAESTHMQRLLSEEWHLDIKVIPNGVFRETPIAPVSSSEKQNVFLTVGRLGTEQKATGDLLSAFQRIKDQTNWQLWLVGPVEDSFRDTIDVYFHANPELKDRVKFFGNISDAEQLTTIYRQAKVFVLPSKWESFALVILEALECGNYLILSDQIPSAADVGRNGKYASVVPVSDIEKLAQAMLDAAAQTVSNEELEERTRWVQERFMWEKIVPQLDEMIKRLYGVGDEK